MTRQRRRTLERQQDIPLLSSSDLSSSKSSLRMETTSSLLETSEPEHSSAFRRVAATSSRVCHTSENQHAPQQPNPAKLALAKSPKRVSHLVLSFRNLVYRMKRPIIYKFHQGMVEQYIQNIQFFKSVEFHGFYKVLKSLKFEN